MRKSKNEDCQGLDLFEIFLNLNKPVRNAVLLHQIGVIEPTVSFL